MTASQVEETVVVGGAPPAPVAEAPDRRVEDGQPEVAPEPQPVRVRRNAVVSAVIGAAASAVAIAYLWRAVGSGSALDWALCALLTAMAVGFLRSLHDARLPLLVADQMGVRIRLGNQWRGLPWEAVDRVVVRPRRGLLRDGRVVVTLRDVNRTVDGLGGRARRHARLNQRIYGAPLAVPIGLTTRVRGSAEEDLTDRFAALSSGRAEVVTLLDQPGAVLAAPVAAPTSTGEEGGDVRPVGQAPGPAPEDLVDRPGVPHRPAVAPVAPLVIDDFEPEPAYDPVIGPELAAARTRVGLSVDELAERTRIRPHVIESIEVDDFAPCGGDFYARGHIRTLARVLGKDPVPLLASFEARYATAPVDARTVFEAELATGLTGTVRSAAGGPNWTLLVGAVLILVLVWSAVRLLAGGPEEVLEPAPLVDSSAQLRSGYAEPRPHRAPQPVVTRLVAVNAGAHVEIRDGDGVLVYEGDLVIGEEQTVRVDPPVTVTSDNAGALSVSVDGQDEGVLGDLDQPATRVFQRPG